MAKTAKAEWISEHVAFTRTAEVDLGHLNPVPLTRDSLSVLVDHAFRELGARRFAVLYPQNSYGRGMRKLYWDAVMAHGGKMALLGILPPTEIDWDFVVFNGLTIKGVYGRLMYETWYKVTMLIQSGLDISPLITHRLDYTEFEKGFEAMRSGSACKVILDWADAS